MTAMIDRQVNELLALLKELEIDERTIVFFCSDNGAANRFDGVLNSSGALRGHKGLLYEGGIRVPMIVRWPGRVKRRIASDHVWYFADVMPTLAELAGVEPPEGIDGISIVPMLLGEDAVGRSQRKHEFLYWEWQQYNWAKRRDVPGALGQAVRTSNWKAVRPKNGAPIELYDLSKDIGETHNVAAQHPEIVARIEAYLETCRTPPRPQVEPEKPERQQYR